jgi:exonuclease I
MNYYAKVQEIFQKAMTPKSRYNQLVSVVWKTEDDKLQNLIKEYLDVAGFTHALRTPERIRLSQYCTQKLEERKPEWQIMAERKNWTPPSQQKQ